MQRFHFSRLIALMVFGGISSFSMANSYVNEVPSLRSRYLVVEVRDENSGNPFPVFLRSTPRKGYLGGEVGHGYKLALTNTGNVRLKVVVSVDGVNVVTGENASIHQTGYVISPHSTTVIDGWRKSLNNAAKFIFSNPRESYASQTGRKANVGVIGFAVFQEARPIYERSRNMDSMDSAGGARAEKAAPASSLNSLGTAHGESVESQARMTTFNASSDRPIEVLELKYDTLQNLERIGVALVAQDNPTAFPADGFVPDPPNQPYVR